MKRFYLLIASALALGMGYAAAQNINRSVQTAPGTGGPIGLDTSNNAFFGGHLNAFANGAGTTTTSCGGALTSATVSGNDAAGRVVSLPAAVGCQLMFGGAYNGPPSCIVTFSANTSFPFVTTSTTSFYAQYSGTSSGATMFYVCIGNQ